MNNNENTFTPNSGDASSIHDKEAEKDYKRMYLQSQIKFNIEKDCKNQAYFFILSHGLYNQFVNYNRKNHSSNPHKNCVDYFAQQADIKERLGDNN